MTKPQVIVYSRPGCHLCDEAKAAILSAVPSGSISIAEVNIENHPALLEKYRYDIPVVLIDGEEIFRHRVDTERFRALMQMKLDG